MLLLVVEEEPGDVEAHVEDQHGVEPIGQRSGSGVHPLIHAPEETTAGLVHGFRSWVGLPGPGLVYQVLG